MVDGSVVKSIYFFFPTGIIGSAIQASVVQGAYMNALIPMLNKFKKSQFKMEEARGFCEQLWIVHLKTLQYKI